MKMKILLCVCTLLLTVGIVYYDMNQKPEVITQAQMQKSTTGVQVDDLIFTSFDKQKFNLNNIQEPIVLVHFWATWCSVCMVELPKLTKLIKDMNGKVALVAISIDDKPNVLEKWQHKTRNRIGAELFDNPHIYWAWDENKSLSIKQFNVLRVPETFILSPERKIVRKVVGDTNWTGKSILNTINQHL